VRLADVKNLGRCAGLDEFGEHLARAPGRILDLAVELAVGKGTGAALAELDIGFGIELALAPQPPGVLGALAHGLAAFQDQGPEAHLRQQQAGKQAAGTGTDYHRALRGWRLRRLGNKTIAGVGRGAYMGVAGQARQHCGFVAEDEIQCVGQDDGRPLACVIAAAEYGDVEQFIGGNAQALEDGAAQVGVGVVEGKAEFGQAHGDGRAEGADRHSK